MAQQPKNIRTFIRFRPRFENQTTEIPWRMSEADGTVQLSQGKGDEGRLHKFTNVFDGTKTNADVYASAIQPVINEALSGFHACILSFGQTGSGKTHTVFGYDSESNPDPGIVPRAIDEIFARGNANKRSVRFRVGLSYYEVYNETIKDLLNPEMDSAKLVLREAPVSKAVFVENLTSRICHAAQTAKDLVALGTANKTVGYSYVHDKSSRAHTVLSLTYAAELNVKHGMSTVVSRITFVDLAGSEILSDKFGDQQQKETKAINLSLLSLRAVITALANKEQHIPYRDSVLTRALSQNLSKESTTAVICTCSDEPQHVAMTRGTLRFGDVAHSVEQRAFLNEFTRDAAGIKLKAEVPETIVKLADMKKPAKGADASTCPPPTIEYQPIDTRQGSIQTAIVTPASPVSGRYALCLHAFGNGCNGRDMEFLFDTLAREAGYTIFAPDFPGFGKTPGTRQTSRTERLWEKNGPMEIVVDMLEALTGHKKSAKVLVCGYDWGGNMALSLALSPYKRRLSGLVLFHPSWTDKRELLAPITVPVLLLWIPSDQNHSIKHGKEMARIIKKGSLVSVVPPAGKEFHWGQIEAVLSQHAETWLTAQKLFQIQSPQVVRKPTPPPPALETVPGESEGEDSDVGVEIDDFEDAHEELSSLSQQSSFLACLIVDPIAADEALAMRRKEEADAERRSKERKKKEAEAKRQAALEQILPKDADAPQRAVHELRRILSGSQDERDSFRDGLIGRSGGMSRSYLLSKVGALPLIPPYATLETLAVSGVWHAGLPKGVEALRNFPRFAPGRRVFVKISGISKNFMSTDFGMFNNSSDKKKLLTYRAIVAPNQTPGSKNCQVLLQTNPGANLASCLLSGKGLTPISVPYEDLRKWNDATQFPLGMGGAQSYNLVFEDAIQARYNDVVMRAKINECAIAMSRVVGRLDFEAAIAERVNADPTKPVALDDLPINKAVVQCQLECLDCLRSCMNTIHHVQQGKDPNRLCVPDCGRLATYGQWHCHGMGSTFASLLLPFSTVLGIDVRYRDGFFFFPSRDNISAGWDGVPRELADHTWLEVTLFPSGVSLCCDPSFFAQEGTTVKYEEAYSPYGSRFPVRDFTQAVPKQAVVPKVAAYSHAEDASLTGNLAPLIQ